MKKHAGEQVVRVAKGQRIFEQNAPGGDLYILESGKVRLVHEIGDKKQVTDLEDSGVLDGLSCLTNEPSHFSAVVLEDVVVRKVKWDIISKVIKALPHWMRKLLMHYSDSIREQREEIQSLQSKIEMLEETQLSASYNMKQLLALILLEIEESEASGRDRCYLHSVQTRAQKILGFTSGYVQKLFEILVESGVLLTHLDSDEGKLWIRLEHKSRILNLHESCQSTKALKDALKDAPPPRILRLVSSLLIHVHKMGLLESEMISLPLQDMQHALKTLMVNDVQSENFEEAQKYKLLLIERSSNGVNLRLTPQTVGEKVSCLSALRLIEKMQRSEDKKTG